MSASKLYAEVSALLGPEVAVGVDAFPFPFLSHLLPARDTYTFLIKVQNSSINYALAYILLHCLGRKERMRLYG